MIIIYLYCSALLFYLVLSHFIGDGNEWITRLNLIQQYLYLPVIFFAFEVIFKTTRLKLAIFLGLLFFWLNAYTPVKYDLLLGDLQGVFDRHFLKKDNEDITATSRAKTEYNLNVMSFNLRGLKEKEYYQLKYLLDQHKLDILALQHADQNLIQSVMPENYQIYYHNGLAIISRGTLNLIETSNSYMTYRGILAGRQFTIVNIGVDDELEINKAISEGYAYQYSLEEQQIIREVLDTVGKKSKNTIILGSMILGQANQPHILLSRAGYYDTYRESNLILPFVNMTYPHSMRGTLGVGLPVLPMFRNDFIFLSNDLRIDSASHQPLSATSLHMPVLVELE